MKTDGRAVSASALADLGEIRSKLPASAVIAQSGEEQIDPSPETATPSENGIVGREREKGPEETQITSISIPHDSGSIDSHKGTASVSLHEECKVDNVHSGETESNFSQGYNEDNEIHPNLTSNNSDVGAVAKERKNTEAGESGAIEAGVNDSENTDASDELDERESSTTPERELDGNEEEEDAKPRKRVKGK